MGATILESLSNLKLVGILSSLLMIQLISFYIGAFVTPPPSSFEQFTSVHCHRHHRNHLAIPRHHKNHGVDVSKNCELASSSMTSTDKNQKQHRTGNNDFEMTTFAIQLPLPRDGMDLAYSSWMQTLLVLLIPEFQYEPLLASSMQQEQQVGYTKFENSFPLLIDVDLAVKNKEDNDWTIYARRQGLKRTIKFQTHDLKQSHKLDCEPIQLFELQSLHYDYYLINFEIQEDKSENDTFRFPGRLNEVSGVAIHHNGGFTHIWLVLKTFFFILTLATLIWYCQRLKQLERDTILIERLLIGLGATLTQLNLPAEIISLFFEVPFMMFFNDLRQGIFYCVLLSFWIVFVGEHLLDGTRKNNQLTGYSKELLAICVASMALLVFDLSERGIQTFDPFVTIWESDPMLANLAITVASAASFAYLGFLLYYIYLAFNTISGSQSALPMMDITKRLKYQGMIYRFKFLLCATTVCAISTIIFYGLSHRNEWSYDDDSMNGVGLGPVIEWTSAMLTSVYAMWNSYVIALMILYAPSHKGQPHEEVEFQTLTDANSMDDHDYQEVTDPQLLKDLSDKVIYEKVK